MAVKKQAVQLSIGRIASLACLLEVCASKPGNVHRGADFEDLTFNDFVVSAELLGQAIDSRKTDKLGQLVLDTVQTRASLVSTNTNLGIALLVCPLSIVANNGDLSATAIRRLIKSTNADDAASIYEAIRLANPGGMGQASEMDINADPPEDIVSAMAYSSDKDLIARQYTNNFQQVFEEVVPLLTVGQGQFGSINHAIVYAHVSMLARYGDSLVARKCGAEESEKTKLMARNALQCLIEKTKDEYFSAVSELDFWLRADGHRRNPGTTADLITAGLFVAIVNEHISAPFT